MKLGIITDIHNNRIALQTAIERLNQLECDAIICCGDIIGIGPFPEETVQYIMKIPNLIAVRGNHEKYLLEGMPTQYPNEEQMGLEEMKHHKWEHSLLSAESIQFLRNLPYRKDLTYEGKRISIMHFCMDEEGHYVRGKRNPSEADLKDMFADVQSDIILYGHDHSRTICKADKIYVNVGSLGCPGKDQNVARTGVLKIEDGNIEMQAIDVKYDVERVVNKIDELKYPDAENIKKYFYGIM